ncbi:MAG: SirB2 family protein [Acetobacteraceae bacterium]
MDAANYSTLKLIHVSAVVLSFSGFTARGLGALRGASWVRHRLARTVPHLVDTVLLLSALGMLWVVRLSPWALPWLRAKIIGLVVYIALGTLALRPSITARMPRPRPVRLIAWATAILVFAYIVSVAITKNPLGATLWL